MNRSFRDRLMALASNSWLYHDEKDEARQAAWHDTEEACEAVYARLHRLVRQRYAQWESCQ